MTVKIYHNPNCSKSRQTLELLQENGVEPEIKLYLENPPTKEELENILSLLSVEPREIMRTKEDEYKHNNLADESLTRDDLINAITSYPKLLERPIVVNEGKAAIGRPPENVLDIL